MARNQRACRLCVHTHKSFPLRGDTQRDILPCQQRGARYTLNFYRLARFWGKAEQIAAPRNIRRTYFNSAHRHRIIKKSVCEPFWFSLTTLFLFDFQVGIFIDNLRDGN